MKKVAIVVQRCHQSVVGGAESLAWQYANLLKDEYEVDVLTTTAVDAGYWSNALPSSLENHERVNIRRFHVDIGYSPYRSFLFDQLKKDFAKYAARRHSGSPGSRRLPWSIGLQEELIRNIGPYCQSLLTFLREGWARYHSIIFVTYLYPTTYFGLLEVPRNFALFAPTLHDEEPAYLSAYKHAASRAGSLIWLSEGERRLSYDLWGELPGNTVGMFIDTELREPKQRVKPYLLYCGRIDPNKGCDELFQFFMRFKESCPSDLRLVLTGHDDMSIPQHPDIEFLGFVSEEEKFRLMAGASIYMMPSGKESFSIVTLEAMAQRVPVLASGVCEVIVDHVVASDGGRIYYDYESFAKALREMCSDQAGSENMGERGREYVLTRFTRERIKESLLESVEACARAFAGKTHTPVSAVASSPSREIATVYVEPKSIDISYTEAMPLPAGISEDQLRDLLTSVQVEDGPVEELRNYARQDFRRFIYTLGLIPDEPGLVVLELGANPYFLTTLLHKFRKVETHLANYFGTKAQVGSQRVMIQQTGELITYSYKQFNIEKDSFPYPDDTFDVVLFCEILEHLLSDPVHALAEIRRVLKPEGKLILTTPNVARLENARKIFAGENIYDPYSGYGPYGRHNREYTQQDVFTLLSANGFRIDDLFTADVSSELHGALSANDMLTPLLRTRRPELGQYIFCRCTINIDQKRAAPVRPDWLYRSFAQLSESQ